MGAGMLSCWKGKTDSFMQEEQHTPTTKNDTVESGPNAKEIEVGTTAESLEFRFQLYLYLICNTATFNCQKNKCWAFFVYYLNTCIIEQFTKWYKRSKMNCHKNSKMVQVFYFSRLSLALKLLLKISVNQKLLGYQKILMQF